MVEKPFGFDLPSARELNRTMNQVATLRAGASGLLVFLTAVVNLVLGLLIVILKTALHH